MNKGDIQISDSLLGCFLDTGTLGDGVDWTGLSTTLSDWDWHHQTAPADVEFRIRNAEVVVTNKVVIDASTIATTRALKLICIAATGTNNVDLRSAAERGIPVVNVCNYATPAVAQHVLALMLAHATRWADYAADVTRGAWSRSEFFCRLDYPIEELSGATLGIVGYGTLGQAVARLARAFGMRVLIAERAGAESIRADRHALADVLTQADYVSLHCPLTETTHHLINAQAFDAMKPTACLINTARGQIVDEFALVTALRTGQIAAAALDVLSVEPPPPDHPLLAADIPNLTITPHCSWASRGSRQRVLDGVAANIQAFRNGRAINQVN